MGISCQGLIQLIEGKYPKHHGEDWDNIGLLIGSPHKRIERALVSLDVTQEVIKEAVELGCDIIVSHHPIIMVGIKNIREDLPHGKLIADIIRNGINIYCCHTNFDIAWGGTNDILSNILGVKDVQELVFSSFEKLYKIVVFTPLESKDQIIEALSKNGAGSIGNYSCCTFRTEGIGTFLPNEGTNPYIGQRGKLEEVKELRIETIVPQSKLSKAIKSMLKAHPYEEAAYDIIPLENKGQGYGLGRIGLLDSPKKLRELASIIRNRFNVDGEIIIKVTGNLEREVKKIAICSGSGATTIREASFKGADVLITGDVKFHEAQLAQDLGLSVLDIGHWHSEVVTMEELKNFLKEGLSDPKSYVDVFLSKVSTNPFILFKE